MSRAAASRDPVIRVLGIAHTVRRMRARVLTSWPAVAATGPPRRAAGPGRYRTTGRGEPGPDKPDGLLKWIGVREVELCGRRLLLIAALRRRMGRRAVCRFFTRRDLHDLHGRAGHIGRTLLAVRLFCARLMWHPGYVWSPRCSTIASNATRRSMIRASEARIRSATA